MDSDTGWADAAIGHQMTTGGLQLSCSITVAMTITSTHCAYLEKDLKAELAWVVDNIPR